MSSKTPSEETFFRRAPQQSPPANADWRRPRYRQLLDSLARRTIAFGGVSVIAAVLMIFVYLLVEVLPLFRPGGLGEQQSVSANLAGRASALHLGSDGRGQLLARVEADGLISFWSLLDGQLIDELAMGLPAGDSISSFDADATSPGLFVLGLESGAVIVGSYGWRVSFDGTERITAPELSWPLGRQPVALSDQALRSVAIRGEDRNMHLAAVDEQGQVSLLSSMAGASPILSAVDSGIDASIQRRRWSSAFPEAQSILLDGDGRHVYLRDSTNRLLVFRNEAGAAGATVRPDLLASAALPANAAEVTWLGGGQSLLVSSGQGSISQWLLVQNQAGEAPDGNAMQLREIRRFPAQGAGASESGSLVASDANSRTFLRLRSDGELSINNATSQRQLITRNINATDLRRVAFVADGSALLAEQADGWLLWPLDISHAEVSLSSLWDPVWYEGYPAPDYVWQSSSAGESFEPKLSLLPLTFGTLKAAFYAMLMATPLAICGAIYTGYFMAPGMRRRIKPLVELMEALPTVVLGFLAGLWLAPYVENNLFGIFSLLVLTPLAVLLASFGWSQLPPLIRLQMPPGFEAALLLPVIVVAVLICLTAGPFFEGLFFNGDMKLWLSEELGVGYDQRNAMVVGFAMGFAVIPTMFSLAEDAVFTVPKHLSDGSLALGATSWQSLFHVVLPTASPGIFSAVMIGLGRAVGETMIVLMATGNTPIMDTNIFEGMRTLAANMAVEMPESEVGSSHYRVLFLSAMLLFLFTFVLNTIAEIVRQSLRQKYSNL